MHVSRYPHAKMAYRTTDAARYGRSASSLSRYFVTAASRAALSAKRVATTLRKQDMYVAVVDWIVTPRTVDLRKFSTRPACSPNEKPQPIMNGSSDTCTCPKSKEHSDNLVRNASMSDMSFRFVGSMGCVYTWMVAGCESNARIRPGEPISRRINHRHANTLLAVAPWSPSNVGKNKFV